MIYGLIFLGHATASSQEQCDVVRQYAKKNNFHIDKFISYTQTPNNTLFKPGDSIIVFSWNCLSAIKATLNAFIQYALKNDINIYSATSMYKIDKSKDYEQLLYAFNLYEEIRRNFASGKSIIGIKKRISNGHKPGRHEGSKNKKHILDGKEKEIWAMYFDGASLNAIAKKMKVSPPTIRKFFIN